MATIADSFVSVEGPKKKEVFSLTAVTDADTVSTTIQHPQFGFFVGTSDEATFAKAVNVSISGRTVTLNGDDLSDETGILTVYGF
jgi:hypothetical protein